MESVILVIHVIVSITLVFLIILQQGKGAQVGASFNSGASQTIFGSQSSTSFLTKFITVLACIFFATNLSLAFIAKKQSSEQFDFSPVQVKQEEIFLQGDAPLDFNKAKSAEPDTEKQ